MDYGTSESSWEEVGSGGVRVTFLYTFLLGRRPEACVGRPAL